MRAASSADAVIDFDSANVYGALDDAVGTPLVGGEHRLVPIFERVAAGFDRGTAGQEQMCLRRSAIFGKRSQQRINRIRNRTQIIKITSEST